MAKQPTTPKSLQSRDKAPPVGETGMGADPSSRSNPDTDSKQSNMQDNEVDETDQDIADMTAEQELVANDAPEPDEALDTELAEGDDSEKVQQDEDEEILVRLLHPEGVQHINGHPLETETVIPMKRKDVTNHQERGVAMEEVGDDYDGEVYDVSKPWAPEQKDKHGNVITSEEIASEEA